MKLSIYILLLFTAFFVTNAKSQNNINNGASFIKPYDKNPWYWEYKN